MQSLNYGLSHMASFHKYPCQVGILAGNWADAVGQAFSRRRGFRPIRFVRGFSLLPVLLLAAWRLFPPLLPNLNSCP